MNQFTEDDDYNLSMHRFLEEFELDWEKILSRNNIMQTQLQIGSRLRPLIVLWGYLCSYNTENLKDISYNIVANASVSIELLHKASILLDDWIDKDTSRHGEPSFHIEYGAEFTVMYALHLVSTANQNISDTLNSSINTTKHILGVQKIHNIIHSMSLGAVMELSLKQDDLFNLDKINTIAKLETAEIIGNALQLGYLIGPQYNNQVFELLHMIGIQCGYLFQALNDFEAFSNMTQNAAYKGNTNYDIDNKKKNIVIAMLYEMVSKKDKIKIKSCSGSDISCIAHKYKFKDFFMSDLKIVYENLLDNIASLEKYGLNHKLINAFIDFIEYAREIAFSKL